MTRGIAGELDAFLTPARVRARPDRDYGNSLSRTRIH
jgi:hypothetical protein